MTSENLPVNKVAESGLIVIDLEDYFPTLESIALFDLKEWLFRGLVLREKEFRDALKQMDWSAFRGKSVALCCTNDAIIPQWAWMLVATYLDNAGAAYHFGTPEEVSTKIGLQAIHGMDVAPYLEERVILKGCSKRALSGEAYIAATQKLKPVVKSLMFGEPCSTVPVYKKK